MDKGVRVSVVTLVSHTSNLGFVRSVLQSAGQQNGIQVDFFSAATVYNDRSHPERFECLWPIEAEYSEITRAYMQRVQERCNANGWAPKLFRSAGYPFEETVFSSSQARQVVERAFLEAGCHIKSLPQNGRWRIRPLGDEYFESLGFGALVVTHRNAPNNGPLALWWGDSNQPPSHPLRQWFPLFPRKVNEVSTTIDFSSGTDELSF